MPDSWDFSQRPRRAGTTPQAPVLTYLLTALSVLITAAFLTTNERDAGTLWYNVGHFGFAETPGAAPWSLITTIFIHGSLLHILFNMVWLVQLGRILESTLNPLVYALFILAAAAAGSACEVLISGNTGIGMSGVVYAMFGMMWAGRGMFPAWGAIATRDNLRYFIGWGLFCVVATYVPGLHFGVANGAHGGGFLFGLSVGFLFFSPRRRWAWAAPLALLVGTIAYSAFRLHSTFL